MLITPVRTLAILCGYQNGYQDSNNTIQYYTKHPHRIHRVLARIERGYNRVDIIRTHENALKRSVSRLRVRGGILSLLTATPSQNASERAQDVFDVMCCDSPLSTCADSDVHREIPGQSGQSNSGYTIYILLLFFIKTYI